AFQYTAHKHNIDASLNNAFLKNMRLGRRKSTYLTQNVNKDYIYGSEDVVGLMCLKVFVVGNDKKYEELKSSAMSLGSAFQKVNFLRDLKADYEDLSRSYFPDTNLEALDEESKQKIISDIEEDFILGYFGILKLPAEAKFAV